MSKPDRVALDDALEIISAVNDYAVKMSEIFASKELPDEIGLAQCDVALEMMRFILLVNSNLEEVAEDA